MALLVMPYVTARRHREKPSPAFAKRALWAPRAHAAGRADHDRSNVDRDPTAGAVGRDQATASVVYGRPR